MHLPTTALLERPPHDKDGHAVCLPAGRGWSYLMPSHLPNAGHDAGAVLLGILPGGCPGLPWHTGSGQMVGAAHNPVLGVQ